jgi:hypothetical protein
MKGEIGAAEAPAQIEGAPAAGSQASVTETPVAEAKPEQAGGTS